MAEETVFDLESDGFLKFVTKVYVISFMTPSMKKPESLHDYNDIKDFFKEDRVYIGHNIVAYDFKVLTKVLEIPRPECYYDTLPLARSLMPGRASYGLDSFGEKYGVPKPKVSDWQNISKAEVTHRCEEDVKINMHLWLDLRRKMTELYE